MSQLFVGLLWLLHRLPLRVLAPLGEAFGLLLFTFARERRHVVDTNLARCFPEISYEDRRNLARAHFRWLGRSFLERSLQWWAPQERLEAMIRIRGLEHAQALREAGTPIIFLTPHFVGLDMGGSRLAMEFSVVNIYARQSNPVFDHWIHHGRSRFGDPLLLPRDEGVRGVVRAIKGGRAFYYLPDMDHGRKESIFVPFFNIPTATITGLPRFAKLTGARVVPMVTRMLPGDEGYEVEIGAPWENYPSGDLEADVAFMNAWIEARVRELPEQYYWVHRRFKTRTEGERPFY